MAANTGQGKGFGLFLVGLTVGCAGIAYLSTGIGKVSAIVGAAIVLASLFGFLKIKPLEGATAQKTSSTAMKLVGAVTVCLGWLVTIGGLHAASTVGGRHGRRTHWDCGESVRHVVRAAEPPSTRTQSGRLRGE